ncbi:MULTISPECIES: N,N-dimethylformamidase beta subunit family domain-containing protein [unclassified Streptomyces]|uniref:N,N-dimethylformamidase beta subunit family domain-containing protein n=1 Tax=unclassified Streptomyces TaxID=2593676 RepID=UPI002E27CD3D|nr:N,N-dimethylformamidase beta subunit family domain-containing protein [Streptomyces sp. NBC_00223]
MDEDAALRDHQEAGGEALDRRHFLGAVAAGAAGVAAGAVAGCDPGGHGAKPGTAPHRTPAEQQRPGDADWHIRSLGPADAVEGYTDRVSVLPGETFGLHVSTTAPGFRVSAFRIGWYGGAQARLVWASDRVPGRTQRRGRPTADTRTVRAGWDRSLEVRTEGWPEGAYLLRLDADSGHQRYVPMVVRSAAAHGRTLLMHAPATWQAYNQWGGYSLYQGRDGRYSVRSLSVGFDRPYDRNGAEKFMVYERAAVVLAERLGIPLAYTTGVDVHLDPSVLRGATTAVALGHDEYWTPEQRRHVTAARDAGTNLAFLGANTCFRRVRLEPGPDGGGVRTVVCYKTDWSDDPYLAHHPTMATTDFRVRPGADPESTLTGVIYEGFPTDAPYVVHSADHWIFEGTGVRPGESFDHLVGVEYDRVDPGYHAPSEKLEIVAHSPLVCNGRRSHADSAYYTVPSGAGVFASGTMRWVEGLMAGTRDDGRDHGMDARTGAFVTRATENVLRAFAAGPAAHHHPAPRPNVRTVYGA